MSHLENGYDIASYFMHGRIEMHKMFSNRRKIHAQVSHIHSQKCDKAIDIHGRSQNLRHLAPSWFRHGAQIRGLRIFPEIKITVVRQVCMSPASMIYCCLSVKINTRKTPHGAQRSWKHLYCICFCICGGKNPKTPNLSPMADDAITRSGIGGLGSPVYIYGQ